MKVKQYLFLVASSLLIVGCTTKSEIMPTGKGTYTLFKGDAGPLSSLGELRRDAYRDVSAYCAKENKKFHVIRTDATPRAIGSFPEIEIQFECINE